MSDLNEKCAVFGVFGKDIDVSRLTFFGLFALQHRGQEASGIATNDGGTIVVHKDKGLVANVFNEEIIEKLTGNIAIGHNRYSTNGKKKAIESAQPIFIEDVNLALVHNGNIPDRTLLKAFLEEADIDHTELNDSQMMAEAIAVYMRQDCTMKQATQNAYPLFTGVFSLLLMNDDSLIALRDSHGVRPLSMGAIGDNVVFASETCAFGPTAAEYVRDVLPGEMVVVNDQGVQSVIIEKGEQKLDLFEFIYFSRPDSILAGKSIYDVRKNFGTLLARDCPIEADMVIPVPETSIPVAIGYSQATGIPFEFALNKNRYIHRTFIQPEQKTRDQSVKMKLSPMPGVVEGKRIILIDDSIVRGTTSRALAKTMYDAGAKEVSFLVSSPPVKYPDFYGIDTPKQDKLLAATMSLEEMEEFMGVDRLCFLSLESTIEAVGLPQEQLCTSCFTGEYPVEIGNKRSAVREVSL